MFWIKDALRKKMLFRVQKHRLRDELILIFKERNPFRSLKRLHGICGLSYISRRLRFHKRWKVLFEEAERRILWSREHLPHRKHLDAYVIYMSLFFYSLPSKEIKRVAFDFAFHKQERSRMVSLKESAEKVKRELIKRKVSPSVVFRLLEPLKLETLLAIMVLSKNKRLRQRMEDYLLNHQGQRLHVRGEDLLRLGIKPGPHYKKILSELLYAKIDGRVRSKEEELQLARKLNKEI